MKRGVVGPILLTSLCIGPLSAFQTGVDELRRVCVEYTNPRGRSPHGNCHQCAGIGATNTLAALVKSHHRPWLKSRSVQICQVPSLCAPLNSVASMAMDRGMPRRDLRRSAGGAMYQYRVRRQRRHKEWVCGIYSRRRRLVELFARWPDPDPEPPSACGQPVAFCPRPSLSLSLSFVTSLPPLHEYSSIPP